jgi:hypothetical protein
LKNALTFAAVAETAAGLALLFAPSLVVQLLLGEQLTASQSQSRVLPGSP